MKEWTTEGHLSELALEMWAADEAETHETGAIRSHLEACQACRARETEWRRLFHALASLEAVEPSPSFDDAVMANLRLPAEDEVQAAAWLPQLTRRLRPVALGAAAIWTAAVLVGTAWVQTRLDVSLTALLTGFLAYVRQLTLEALIEVAALLQLSGLGEVFNQASQLSGAGVLVAVALMTSISGLALWTLYRVAGTTTTSRKHANA
ncbi:MAG: hypothetical protein GWN99_12715 [Gemmatimonadetes bacterium]|uniref:Zinc-finger domain-containing protein n=1 Tax=Candidatus Kutchimonas denitrificans TaxID=3056748 RepID=A0AAE4Z861_9BACT|nr:hypothetical protein [Gemmatimonadota bacterium]NIR75594.1 hypothetical protein [Candidatus Kutchimonas denitrificans]NIS01908.1 hypothetical protein [Gemmatimonadota bacterium]NIT67689.1 hypothetical protein [Gemmatimonadota bacterium]NIU53563.1 hypothetical protein [Gemmatimonadota bacterium]